VRERAFDSQKIVGSRRVATLIDAIVAAPNHWLVLAENQPVDFKR
jgi:hypothetical protein